MRLRKQVGNELEFKKKLEKDIHHFSFRKFIDFVIETVQNEHSDDEYGEEDLEPESEAEEENSEMSEDEVKVDKLQKLKASNFLNDTLNITKTNQEENDKVTDDIANELEAMFASKKGHSNLKDWKRNDK